MALDTSKGKMIPKKLFSRQYKAHQLDKNDLDMTEDEKYFYEIVKKFPRKRQPVWKDNRRKTPLKILDWDKFYDSSSSEVEEDTKQQTNIQPNGVRDIEESQDDELTETQKHILPSPKHHSTRLDANQSTAVKESTLNELDHGQPVPAPTPPEQFNDERRILTRSHSKVQSSANTTITKNVGSPPLSRRKSTRNSQASKTKKTPQSKKKFGKQSQPVETSEGGEQYSADQNLLDRLTASAKKSREKKMLERAKVASSTQEKSTVENEANATFVKSKGTGNVLVKRLSFNNVSTDSEQEVEPQVELPREPSVSIQNTDLDDKSDNQNVVPDSLESEQVHVDAAVFATSPMKKYTNVKNNASVTFNASLATATSDQRKSGYQMALDKLNAVFKEAKSPASALHNRSPLTTENISKAGNSTFSKGARKSLSYEFIQDDVQPTPTIEDWVRSQNQNTRKHETSSNTSVDASTQTFEDKIMYPSKKYDKKNRKSRKPAPLTPVLEYLQYSPSQSPPQVNLSAHNTPHKSPVKNSNRESTMKGTAHRNLSSDDEKEDKVLLPSHSPAEMQANSSDFTPEEEEVVVPEVDDSYHSYKDEERLASDNNQLSVQANRSLNTQNEDESVAELVMYRRKRKSKHFISSSGAEKTSQPHPATPPVQSTTPKKKSTIKRRKKHSEVENNEARSPQFRLQNTTGAEKTSQPHPATPPVQSTTPKKKSTIKRRKKHSEVENNEARSPPFRLQNTTVPHTPQGSMLPQYALDNIATSGYLAEHTYVNTNVYKKDMYPVNNPNSVQEPSEMPSVNESTILPSDSMTVVKRNKSLYNARRSCSTPLKALNKRGKSQVAPVEPDEIHTLEDGIIESDTESTIAKASKRVSKKPRTWSKLDQTSILSSGARRRRKPVLSNLGIFKTFINGEEKLRLPNGKVVDLNYTNNFECRFTKKSDVVMEIHLDQEAEDEDLRFGKCEWMKKSAKGRKNNRSRRQSKSADSQSKMKKTTKQSLNVNHDSQSETVLETTHTRGRKNNLSRSKNKSKSADSRSKSKTSTKQKNTEENLSDMKVQSSGKKYGKSQKNNISKSADSQSKMKKTTKQSLNVNHDSQSETEIETTHTRERKNNLSRSKNKSKSADSRSKSKTTTKQKKADETAHSSGNKSNNKNKSKSGSKSRKNQQKQQEDINQSESEIDDGIGEKTSEGSKSLKDQQQSDSENSIGETTLQATVVEEANINPPSPEKIRKNTKQKTSKPKSKARNDIRETQQKVHQTNPIQPKRKYTGMDAEISDAETIEHDLSRISVSVSKKKKRTKKMDADETILNRSPVDGMLITKNDIDEYNKVTEVPIYLPEEEEFTYIPKNSLFMNFLQLGLTAYSGKKYTPKSPAVISKSTNQWLDCGMIVVMPKKKTAFRTDKRFTILHCIEGECAVTVNKVTCNLVANDWVLVPALNQYKFRSLNGTKCQFYYIKLFMEDMQAFKDDPTLLWSIPRKEASRKMVMKFPDKSQDVKLSEVFHHGDQFHFMNGRTFGTFNEETDDFGVKLFFQLKDSLTGGCLLLNPLKTKAKSITLPDLYTAWHESQSTKYTLSFKDQPASYCLRGVHTAY